MDLNRLVALDARMRAQGVTAAARRLGVTQSAMSHTLRRLRETLGDPILGRQGMAMVPTPRAQELTEPLRRCLIDLERLLVQPAQFDALASRRTFRVASPDLFDALILPDLLRRLGAEAPHINLSMSALSGAVRRSLETGQLDVAVLPTMDDVREDQPLMSAPGMRRRAVLRDSSACMIRARHPATRELDPGDPLPLDTFVSLPHALLSPRGEGAGIVDRALGELGLSRRIALRLDSFHLAPFVIASSDLLITAPTAMAKLVSPGTLDVFSAPVSLPTHTLNLVWHERYDDDPGHRWFRSVLADAASRVMSPS